MRLGTIDGTKVAVSPCADSSGPMATNTPVDVFESSCGVIPASSIAHQQWVINSLCWRLSIRPSAGEMAKNNGSNGSVSLINPAQRASTASSPARASKRPAAKGATTVLPSAIFCQNWPISSAPGN